MKARDCPVSRACTTLFRRGAAALKAGRMDKACTLFEQLHATCPSAQSAWALAVTASQRDDHVAIVRWVTTALDEPHCAFREHERQRAQELLASAEKHLARYHILPLAAQLTIDGLPATREFDGSLLLEKGTHRLKASAEGHLPQQMDIRVRGGEQLAMSLVPTTGPPRLPPPAGSLAREQASSYSAAWITAGGAATLGAAGAILYVLASDAHANMACQPYCIPNSPETRASDNLLLASRLSLGLAIAAASTAIVLFAWPPDADDPGADQEVQVGLGHVRLRF